MHKINNTDTSNQTKTLPNINDTWREVSVKYSGNRSHDIGRTIAQHDSCHTGFLESLYRSSKSKDLPRNQGKDERVKEDR